VDRVVGIYAAGTTAMVHLKPIQPRGTDVFSMTGIKPHPVTGKKKLEFQASNQCDI